MQLPQIVLPLTRCWPSKLRSSAAASSQAGDSLFGHRQSNLHRPQQSQPTSAMRPGSDAVNPNAIEAAAMPSEKYKDVIAKLVQTAEGVLGLRDDRLRIAKIAYDRAMPIWQPGAAYFARHSEIVLRSNTPARRPARTGPVVLLSPEMAVRFQDLGLVERVPDTFNIQVKTTCHGQWNMTVSGRMRATLSFTDKHCFEPKKEIFVDNTAKDNVEFWVLAGSDVRRFPYDIYVTSAFVDQEDMESPAVRALELGRQGVRLAPAGRLSGHAHTHAMHRLRDEVAAQASEQREQQRLMRERLRQRAQTSTASTPANPHGSS